MQTRKQFEKEGYIMQWYVMSMEIILTTLGPEWWKKNCTSDDPKHQDDFLKKKDSSDDESYKIQGRVIYLGHLLHALKDSKGFEIFVEALKSRDLESCNWELSVAYRFMESGYAVEFVQESGVKGNDYDLLVLKETYLLNVEAKSRESNPNNEGALKNVLNHARSQLPKNGNGVIYISIPLTWTEKPNVEKTISEIIEAFLRNTSRVKFVVIEWSSWIEVQPQGRVLIQQFKTYRNSDAGELLELSLKKEDPANINLFSPSYWK